MIITANGVRVEVAPGVDLSGANLSGADLSGVDLSGVKAGPGTDFTRAILR